MKAAGGRAGCSVRVKAQGAAAYGSSSAVSERAAAKEALLRAVQGTERGSKTTSSQRAEIAEKLAELEQVAPQRSPTAELDQLSGRWRLVYTSNSELAAFFALNALPLLDIGTIEQIVDARDSSVTNTVNVSFAGGLASTTFSADASLEPISNKRFAVEFEGGRLATPSLQDDVLQALPDTVQLFGRSVDIASARDALAPQLTTAIRSAQGLLSARGEDLLSLPIPSTLRAQLGDVSRSWLLTTYLDSDLRIARGDAGSVFVLVREEAQREDAIVSSAPAPSASPSPSPPANSNGAERRDGRTDLPGSFE